MARTVRFRLALALGVALLVGACATPRDETPAAPPQAGVTPPADVARATPRVAPRAGKKRAPIPTRALNVAADCSFQDENGYNGVLKLAVEDAQVRLFDAVVTVPRHGACRFALKDFRQTRTLPTVELRHLRERCIVRMWEQDERVTVAFDQCNRMCSGAAYDHLWPILTDRRAGSCA